MKTPRTAALSRLLVELFTDDELRRFMMHWRPEVFNTLPPNGSLEALADHVANALQKRGMIDGVLFAELRTFRPGRAKDISSVHHDGSSRWRGKLFLGLAAVGFGFGAFFLLRRENSPILKTSSVTADPLPPAVSAPASPCPPSMALVSGDGGTNDIIKPFCIDLLEVTRGDFGLQCPSEGETMKHGLVHKKAAEYCRSEDTSSNWGAHPVAWISAEEAAEFCASRRLRLPSLEEWRLAAQKDFNPDFILQPVKCMNVCDRTCWEEEYAPSEGWLLHSDHYPRSAPVGSYISGGCPSNLGLGDIHGNAREIVKSEAGFATCGSGWRSNTEAHLKPDAWCSENAPLPQQDIGFRCAQDADLSTQASNARSQR